MFRTSRVPKRTGFEREARAWSTKHADPENVGEYGCNYPTKAAPSDSHGWWDNCGWVFLPWWGWLVICEDQDGLWDDGRDQHDELHHDDWR
jgi:hypothetical protein